MFPRLNCRGKTLLTATISHSTTSIILIMFAPNNEIIGLLFTVCLIMWSANNVSVANKGYNKGPAVVQLNEVFKQTNRL